ncbi:MAG: thiolase family protein [Spirochaetaceae bacterium]|nr:thiolase family protein [Spirochaetaceae bacterium]
MGKTFRKVMMLGGAVTPPSIPMDWTWRELATEAYCLALDAAGVKPREVDLACVAYNDRTIVDSSIGPQVADALALAPKPVLVTSSACAGNGVASWAAWNAIASGRCDIVVSLGFARSDNYDAMEAMNSEGNYCDYDYLMGLTHINYGGLRDDYYRRKYGATIEDAARWVHQCHWFARRNPLAAEYSKPMPSLEELSADTPEAERQRQATNRGGVASAFVLCGEEIAGRFTDKPVQFDVAYAYRPPYMGNFNDWPVEGLRGFDMAELSGLMVAAKEAYAMAGVTAADAGVCQVHDLTAFEGFMAIEALGLAPLGKGADYVRSGGMALGSKCPVNTYGGGPAFGHGSVGCDFQAGVIENFLQLRGECGERQVDGARVGVNSSYGTHHSLDVAGVVQRRW